MHHWTKAFLLAVALFTTLHANAAHLVNLGCEFDAFVAASNGKTQAETEAEWVKFEARHQEIYDDAVYRKSEPGWEQRIRMKRDRFLSDYASLAPKMDDLFAQAGSIVAKQETRFRALFPDLSPDIPVVFMPSLRSFNGQVRDISTYGRPTLLMGVDFIVERNDNLDVLFSHEFFHAYHESHLKQGSTGQSMATPLWKEGFATYVSGVLNPNLSDAELLMDPVLAHSCDDPTAVSLMAADFLKVLATDGANSYADWFMMSGTTQPTRRGYCLGLRIIRTLAASHPVTEMVNWDEARFSLEASAVLQAWSTNPKGSEVSP